MIKFRAWYMPFGKYGAMQEMVYSRASHILALAETEPEKYIPEQFTGLKDVNCDDIYENDIIVSRPTEPILGSPKIGVVKLSKVSFSWCCETENIEYNIWKTDRYRTYEVIGNVHANPELLEAEK
ncbi:YopX family protein [Lactiplantibacillus paraplantarum]|uniref:YopX family protein n=1 Tax=Lactiplantibacillus paraplantarum TaxID=60520 RepID=UPI002551E226|nr:YopX family protein [Lactiplantibacillus paraplantarum]MDL2061532.1 YopX family protein [Lactiplantibacillus paraplantarum]